MEEEQTISFSPEDYVRTNNAQQQAYCDQYNANAYSHYRQTIENINRSLDAGRPAPIPAPPVPTKWVLTPPDGNGLQWQTTSDEPTGPELPLHPDMSQLVVKAPNTIDIGRNIAGKWFSVGANDTFPPGLITPPIPDASGALHTYEKYAAPVGAGWYLQLS